VDIVSQSYMCVCVLAFILHLLCYVYSVHYCVYLVLSVRFYNKCQKFGVKPNVSPTGETT